MRGLAYQLLKEDVKQHLMAGNSTSTLRETLPPKGAGSWKPSEEAVLAFDEARRNEEPVEFRDHSDVELASSDDENHTTNEYESGNNEEL